MVPDLKLINISVFSLVWYFYSSSTINYSCCKWLPRVCFDFCLLERSRLYTGACITTAPRRLRLRTENHSELSLITFFPANISLPVKSTEISAPSCQSVSYLCLLSLSLSKLSPSSIFLLDIKRGRCLSGQYFK